MARRSSQRYRLRTTEEGSEVGQDDDSASIDYDSVAEVYDLYVTADYDVPFFPFDAAWSLVKIWRLEKRT
jgi:hypothetical protein